MLRKGRMPTGPVRWREISPKVSTDVVSCQLVMSSWDIRGFTLEANIEKLDPKKTSASRDLEPCTGDQLADSEKVATHGKYHDRNNC